MSPGCCFKINILLYILPFQCRFCILSYTHMIKCLLNKGITYFHTVSFFMLIFKKQQHFLFALSAEKQKYGFLNIASTILCEKYAQGNFMPDLSSLKSGSILPLTLMEQDRPMLCIHPFFFLYNMLYMHYLPYREHSLFYLFL